MVAETRRFDVVGHLASLRRYARSLTRSETDSEDLVQEALLRAYEKRASYREGRQLGPWLLSILHNVFIDRQRSRSAEARRMERVAELQLPHLAPAQDDHVRLGEVRRAFMALPEEQRAALHLVAIEGFTFAEAAVTLEIPIGTLMSRLSRARASLRAIESDGKAGGGSRPHLWVVGGSDGSSR
jgi:RNA polymerase sigma-70 factor (ECF subfamily)